MPDMHQLKRQAINLATRSKALQNLCSEPHNTHQKTEEGGQCTEALQNRGQKLAADS